MSTANGQSSKLYGNHVSTGHQIRRQQFGNMSITGTLTLTRQYANILRIDPTGGHRDVVLPAEAGSDGFWFEISNWADAAENLVVKDDAAATIATINQNEKCSFFCDGTSWYHNGVVSIALT